MGSPSMSIAAVSGPTRLPAMIWQTLETALPTFAKALGLDATQNPEP